MRKLLVGLVVGIVAFGGGHADAATLPTWTVVTTPAMSGDVSQGLLNQITSVRGGTVFAAGYTRHDLPGTSEVRTLVERWNGTAWEVMSTPDVETAPAADYLYGISGSSATDVWAVGRSATSPGHPTGKPLALHWDGTTWTIAAVPDPSGGAGADMYAVVSTGKGSAWAAGTAYPLEAAGAVYRLDHGTWSSFRLPLLPGCGSSNYTELTAITATPSGDVYAGGDCPTASGYGGFIIKMVSLTQWQVVARIRGRSNIADLTASADGTVWATGTLSDDSKLSRGFLLFGSGTTWQHSIRNASTETSEVSTGVAVTPTGITIVGEVDTRNGQRSPFIATYASGRWSKAVVTPSPTATEWLSAVTGSATGPVWATGHYLGSQAKIVPITAHPS